VRVLAGFGIFEAETTTVPRCVVSAFWAAADVPQTKVAIANTALTEIRVIGRMDRSGKRVKG
jgi:hypothetical protein